MECGVADVRLELGAGHAQHRRPRRPGRLGGGLQERGLADAGFAGQDQRAAVHPDPVQEAPQELGLLTAPHQGHGPRAGLHHA